MWCIIIVRRAWASRLSIMFRSLQVRAMHKRHIYTRNSAHDLSVKLGPCIHSHKLSTYQDTYLCVTNPALCNDKSVCCLLRLAPRWWNITLVIHACVVCVVCVVCVCMQVNVPATLLPNFIFLVMEGSVDGFLITYMTAHRREQFLQWVENLPDNQTPASMNLS